MAAGQYYDPRSRPQSNPASGWTLLSHPELDRVHVWVRSLGELDVYVKRVAGDWWEIEIRDESKSIGNRLVHEAEASSGVAAFAKVNLWAWSRMEIKV